jgi:hypothetical protein
MLRVLALLSSAALFTAGTAWAGVTPLEAATLGGPELTPLGAERDGNAAGTIPPWTGGITGPVPGYQAGEHHVDPFPGDQRLFAITATNMQQHAENLSEGQQALLKQYPDSWRMNVYPTRRSAAYPDFVYAALNTNATSASVIPAGHGGVRGAVVTSPFPIPRQGEEVVWNHILRWRGIHAKRTGGLAAVTRRGDYTLLLTEEEWAIPYAKPGTSELKTRFPDLLGTLKQKVIAPGFEAGSGALLVEPFNYNTMQRQNWIYSANLRRVLRTPFGGFDTPAQNTDALRFNDEVDMYNGSPVLFNWKLLGKRELYIPYNAYRLHSDALEVEDILQRHHINPDHARYELHRVWVVEGTVKVRPRNPNALLLENRGHLYSRRVFYIDEDSWQIAVADNYDMNGQLWRFSEGHMINFYEVPVPWYTLQAFYELKQQRYLVTGLNNQRRGAEFDEDINPRLFGPNALDYYLR